MVDSYCNDIFKTKRTQQRVIQYEFGYPGTVLALEDAEIPMPQDGEILVRMKLRSINPSDLLTILGVYSYRTSLPRVPGYEGVGVVVAQGKNVCHPRLGTRVLALRGGGTWQEYVIVPAEEAVPVPDAVDDKNACQLYINPLTAWVMLTEELRPQKGDFILANAAGSAFGRILAQLSRILNFRFIAVTRSENYTEQLINLGAEAVINSSREDILEKVNLLTNGKGANFALDAVGGESGRNMLQCLRTHGRFLIYGLLSGEQIKTDSLLLAQRRGIGIDNFWLRDWAYSHPAIYRMDIFFRLIEFVAKGQLQLSDIKEYPLEDVNSAVVAAEQNHNRHCKIALRSSY